MYAIRATFDSWKRSSVLSGGQTVMETLLQAHLERGVSLLLADFDKQLVDFTGQTKSSVQ